ncbi:MAG: ATPase, T2SS/T4P/T4SS family [Vicinamibacterales bacterium]
MSLDLILPFLRPLAPLLTDPTVSEILVNGPDVVYIERDGVLAPVPELPLDARAARRGADHRPRPRHRPLRSAAPLDARLPDGSRVAAAIAPVAVAGTTLTIRKFGPRLHDLDALIARGMLTPGQRDQMTAVLAARRNVLISGGTGTGKTTLLNALTNALPATERLLVIEETAELRLTHPHVVRWEARRAEVDRPAVTIRDLVRAALRHRPDRLIVGEVRGPEAFDLLQALNTGHGGSLTTIHANDATHALARLGHCVLEAETGLSPRAIRALVADAIALVVHTHRLADGRRAVAAVQPVQPRDRG